MDQGNETLNRKIEIIIESSEKELRVFPYGIWGNTEVLDYCFIVLVLFDFSK